MTAYETIFSAALHALVPPPEAGEDAYLPAFRRLARLRDSKWEFGRSGES
jgi:hypothetical protein